jgi:large subunit ribosomal protein L10
MPTPQKEALVAEIRAKFDDSNAVILADYRGLSVKDMQVLRNKLREVGAEVSVYKNSLSLIAVTDLGLQEGITELLVGPTMFVFAPEDPVAPAKALVDFAKSHEALQVKGGLMEKAPLDAAGVKAVAALPSREELLAKLLGTMQNPLVGIVRVLNGPAEAFARVVKAIADQKEAA